MIALPAAILGLPPVQEVLFDRGPRIELDLTSEIAVLDIRNPMRGLSVSLYGSDINASKESLIASRVAIRNKGKDGIKPNDVASSDPLGFFITGGELIQITKFSASTEHLRKFAQPKRLNNKVTVNTDLIMDSGDRIVFDLLIKKS